MSPITTDQFWAGVAILAIAIIIGDIAWLHQQRSIDRDNAREESARMKAEAREYAIKLARKLFLDYVAAMRINFKVECINESDIPWSAEDLREEERSD